VEQRKDYSPQYVALSSVLFATCIGAIVMLAIVLTVLAGIEVRKSSQQRRLCWCSTGVDVKLPPPPPAPKWWAHKEITPWHLFLSHNWAQGQSDVHIIKRRLLEMLPSVRVFLDVDNLGTGTRNSLHVDISNAVLCFCTSNFFKSGPCAMELVRAVVQQKPILALLDTDEEKGGLSEADCRQLLSQETWVTENKPRVGLLSNRVAEWGVLWGKGELRLPAAKDIETALFASPPLVWSRLSDMQDVTMRLIAERLIGISEALKNNITPLWRMQPRYDDAYRYKQQTYIQQEIGQQLKQHPLVLSLHSQRRRFHLYCSQFNKGAAAVAQELSWLLEARGVAQQLAWTEDSTEQESCEMMLIHLNRTTWTEVASTSLALDVANAMRSGLRLVCVHEVVGARIGDGARQGCSFEEVLQATPMYLQKPVKGQGIYGTIAFNLAAGEWREAGLVRLALAIAPGGGERQPRELPQTHKEREEGDVANGRPIANISGRMLSMPFFSSVKRMLSSSMLQSSEREEHAVVGKLAPPIQMTSSRELPGPQRLPKPRGPVGSTSALLDSPGQNCSSAPSIEDVPGSASRLPRMAQVDAIKIRGMILDKNRGTFKAEHRLSNAERPARAAAPSGRRQARGGHCDSPSKMVPDTLKEETPIDGGKLVGAAPTEVQAAGSPPQPPPIFNDQPSRQVTLLRCERSCSRRRAEAVPTSQFL